MDFQKRIIRFGIVLSICGFISFSLLNAAESAEQVYDVDVCVSMDVSILVQSKEITILTWDAKGIMRSNIESKIFDNWTVHTLGVVEIRGKNRTVYGHMKYLAPDGDFVIFRYTLNPGDKAATTTLLSGTGKWKGITGGGKAIRITKGKPVVKGTAQFCNNHKGKFTLPK
jgi:hypothetical protein